ncbi:hypothetical protein F5Y17DRAFT_459962 [Xylariaceae sp. FL0594]|nr:hypothetical protein F5Y17DRAFT_459962 [Xylariaceae sp. FL0594]
MYETRTKCEAPSTQHRTIWKAIQQLDKDEVKWRLRHKLRIPPLKEILAIPYIRGSGGRNVVDCLVDEDWPQVKKDKDKDKTHRDVDRTLRDEAIVIMRTMVRLAEIVYVFQRDSSSDSDSDSDYDEEEVEEEQAQPPPPPSAESIAEDVFTLDTLDLQAAYRMCEDSGRPIPRSELLVRILPLDLKAVSQIKEEILYRAVEPERDENDLVFGGRLCVDDCEPIRKYQYKRIWREPFLVEYPRGGEKFRAIKKDWDALVSAWRRRVQAEYEETQRLAAVGREYERSARSFCIGLTVKRGRNDTARQS